MLKKILAEEKTNSYRPEPWAWSEEPFPAFRGSGQRYSAFLAVAKGFKPTFGGFSNTETSDDFSKIVTTAKGTRLLVPCGEKEDEKTLLITALGGFRGDFGRIEAIGAEILWEKSMTMHCAPVAHIIARITSPEGYILTESGRRTTRGYIEVFSWKGGYFGMPTEEYEAAVESDLLFAGHDTAASEIARCKAKAQAEADSRKAKAAGLGTRMEVVNARIKAAGTNDFWDGYKLGKTYFDGNKYNKNMLYTEKNVALAEAEAAEVEKKARLRVSYAEWRPRFEEAAKKSEFTAATVSFGDSAVEYCSNVVVIRSSLLGSPYPHFEYSAEGLARFKEVLPIYEEDFQKRKAKETRDAAEAKVREEAQARKAEAEAKAREIQLAAEAEAKAAGLPSDVKIWHRDGATHAGKGWVIVPNGTERECDRVDTSVCGSNSKKYHQSYEGDHVWNQILPGEVVLSWRHAYTAADHEFEVVYRPESLTEAQKERIAEIEQDMENRFFGAVGLTGTSSCPSIGDGWGLVQRREPEPDTAMAAARL